jgi:hypothetical protein
MEDPIVAACLVETREKYPITIITLIFIPETRNHMLEEDENKSKK